MKTFKQFLQILSEKKKDKKDKEPKFSKKQQKELTKGIVVKEPKDLQIDPEKLIYLFMKIVTSNQ